MRPRRRWVPALAGALALLGATATVAEGAAAFRASVAPAVVSAPARIEYALTMVNDGDGDERFSVFVVPPVYGLSRPTATDGFGEGASIRPVGLPRIEGPGTIASERIASVTVPKTRCSVSGAGGHGYQGRFRSFDVTLPSRTTSTLRATYATDLPLWRDLDLRLRFELGTELTTGARGTLPRARVLVSPQPAIAGRVAVHLTLRTTPLSGSRSFAAARPIARGRRVEVAGRADPPIPGERVQLRFARIGRSGRVAELGRAGRAGVDAKGAFRASWLPPRRGDYELWARYDSRLPDIVSDDTCPRLLRIR
jgi:hypothetical protein